MITIVDYKVKGVRVMPAENARIEPVLPPQWNETIREALGAFPKARDFVLSHWEKQDDLRGLHLMGTFARHPALARAFLTFNAHAASTLTARDREILILRISWLRYSEYEYVQHLVLARRAGLTDAEIERIQRGADAEGWTANDADLLRAVDELHRDARIGAQTWSRLAQRYDSAQLMDLIFTVGCYEIIALAANSFATPLEPGVTPLDPATVARMGR